jgi:hypothetical protein
MSIALQSIEGAIGSLASPRKTPALRACARDATNSFMRLSDTYDAELVLKHCVWLVELDAQGLCDGGRFVGFEIAHMHPHARDALNWRWLERLGRLWMDGRRSTISRAS